MRILFLGDVVGISGCSKLMNNLLNEIKLKKIDFGNEFLIKKLSEEIQEYFEYKNSPSD